MLPCPQVEGFSSVFLPQDSHFGPWLLCGIQVKHTMCSSHCLDAGQSKCRLERAQALEQAKKPQEAVFVPECGEDGSFTQVRPHRAFSGEGGLLAGLRQKGGVQRALGSFGTFTFWEMAG